MWLRHKEKDSKDGGRGVRPDAVRMCEAFSSSSSIPCFTSPHLPFYKGLKGWEVNLSGPTMCTLCHL